MRITHVVLVGIAQCTLAAIQEVFGLADGAKKETVTPGARHVGVGRRVLEIYTCPLMTRKTFLAGATMKPEEAHKRTARISL